MKTLLALLFLACQYAYAQPFTFQDQAWMGKVATPVASASLPTPDIYYQDFESGTKPTGWSDYSYHSAAVYNYTPPLLGSYSLGLHGVGSNPSSALYTLNIPTNEIYIFYELNPLRTIDYQTILMLKDNAGSDILSLRWKGGSSGVNLYDGNSQNGVSPSATMSTTATNYVWIHYKIGNGSNGQYSIGFSSTMTEPTSGAYYAGRENGTNQSQVASIRFQTADGEYTNIVDHIGIATFAMPNGW
jgi:hypothetical protein